MLCNTANESVLRITLQCPEISVIKCGIIMWKLICFKVKGGEWLFLVAFRLANSLVPWLERRSGMDKDTNYPRIKTGVSYLHFTFTSDLICKLRSNIYTERGPKSTRSICFGLLPASCCFLVWPIFRPWRWKRFVPFNVGWFWTHYTTLYPRTQSSS